MVITHILPFIPSVADVFTDFHCDKLSISTMAAELLSGVFTKEIAYIGSLDIEAIASER